jgi:hypothetical protein
MKFKYVLLTIIIILTILFLYNKQENIDSTNTLQNLSNEAIQNIASVYNNKNLQVTNLKVTNDINASGNIIGSLTSSNKKFQINMQDNGDMGCN